MSEKEKREWKSNSLRFLVYIAMAYKLLYGRNGLFGTAQIKLPSPKFVVFYNGRTEIPEKQALRLSDAFENKSDNPSLELVCKVYNINPGYNEAMKSECVSIGGYVKYSEKVKKYSVELEITNALEKAIDECIEEGILREFFEENRNMIISADAIDCTLEAQKAWAIKEIQETRQKMQTMIDAEKKLAEEAKSRAEEANSRAEEANNRVEEEKKNRALDIISICRENGASDEVIIGNLTGRLGWTEDDAKDFLKTH